MFDFFTKYWAEILLTLVSAGSLTFCKFIYNRMKDYKELLEEKDQDKLEDLIDDKLEPILDALEKLRKAIQEVETNEKNHIDIILSSYRFRLIQLCKIYLTQEYMTQDQYDQLTEFYKIYHDLGGNSQGQTYYEKTIKLPIHEN